MPSSAADAAGSLGLALCASHPHGPSQPFSPVRLRASCPPVPTLDMLPAAAWASRRPQPAAASVPPLGQPVGTVSPWVFSSSSAQSFILVRLTRSRLSQ